MRCPLCKRGSVKVEEVRVYDTDERGQFFLDPQPSTITPRCDNCGTIVGEVIDEGGGFMRVVITQ
jgi:hypothetical protein